MHGIVIDPIHDTRFVVNVLIIADEYERDDKLYDVMITDVVTEDQFIQDIKKRVNCLDKPPSEIREFLRNEMRISASYADELMGRIVKVESL